MNDGTERMTSMKALYKNLFKSGSAAERQGKLINFNAAYSDVVWNKRFPILINDVHEFFLVMSLLEPTGLRWQGGQELQEYNPFSMSHVIYDLQNTNSEGDCKKLILLINGEGKMTHDVQFPDSFKSEFSESNYFVEDYSICTVAEFKRIYQEDIGPSSLLLTRKHVKLTNPSFLIRKDK